MTLSWLLARMKALSLQGQASVQMGSASCRPDEEVLKEEGLYLGVGG